MKLIDKLNQEKNKRINQLYESLFTDLQHDREDKIQKIYDYYLNIEHYPYFFDDAEITFLDSTLPYNERKKVFKTEIQTLKNKYFLVYNKTTREYELYEELMQSYQKYKKEYNQGERERYGIYRFLIIAYVYAYGVLMQDELFQLMDDMFSGLDIDELIDIVKQSNGYQGKVKLFKKDGDYYFAIPEEGYIYASLALRDQSNIEDFALLDEDTLAAYYHDGYDSTNTALFELKEMLQLNKSEEEIFKDLVILTYALLQPKDRLVKFVLTILRYAPVTNEYIIDALNLIDEAYLNYGSWVTKGFSPRGVEKIIQENFERMKEEFEAGQYGNQEKEEPIN